MSDLELLQQYVRDNSQAAFTALVERHINLVYSAAQRQVRSPQLAEEIAQSVFFDLSRHAAKLSPTQPLAAWLYVVTRRSAIDVARRESRRLARDTTAMEIAAIKTPPETWSKVEARLDEAMETLNDTERSALVLRFFENQSLREVGDSLGISEDTAQKRVSRALDRLRVFFGRRGVAVGATALAADLSAHAAQAAPAGLAAAISSSAATLPSMAVVAAKQLAMTTTQKILATTALAAALGFALFEGNAAVRFHGEVSAGQQNLDRLAETARQLRLERAAVSRQIAALERGRPGEPGAAERGSDDALTREAAAWFVRINQLKQALVRHPELGIPELQLLTERDWLLAAVNTNSASEENLAESLRFLRTVAKQNFTKRITEASKNYFSTTDMRPTQFDQLAPLLSPPVDPAILSRYDFQTEGDQVFVAEKLAGAADLDHLAYCAWENVAPGRRGFWASGWETAQGRTVREAAQSYAKAHDGSRATDPTQLLPFLAQPPDTVTLAELFEKLPFSRSSTPPTR